MKAVILAMLRQSETAVSGESISERLGVSRVAVWKHIHRLQELGYRIAAGAQGYRLLHSPDALFPWEFGPREARIHYHARVDSTMDIARKLAREDCPDFTVVIAESQRRGRGRLGRRWNSAAGGLYFTIVLRPQIAPVLSARVNFFASLMLVLTLREELGIAAAVKWPNDILVGERKLAGMLSEMESAGGEVSFVNIGIGINVNNDPVLQEPNAVSLRVLMGKPVGRRKLLEAFLDRLERNIDQAASAQIVDRWKRHTTTLGRAVRVVTRRRVFQGLAMDVDANGALLLRQTDGTLQTVTHGDCFHRNPRSAPGLPDDTPESGIDPNDFIH